MTRHRTHHPDTALHVRGWNQRGSPSGPRISADRITGTEGPVSKSTPHMLCELLTRPRHIETLDSNDQTAEPLWVHIRGRASRPDCAGRGRGAASRVAGPRRVRTTSAAGMAQTPLTSLEPRMLSADRHLTDPRYRTASAAAHGTGKSLSDTPSRPRHHQKRLYPVNWVAAGIRSTPQRAAGHLNADDPHIEAPNP